MKNVIIRSLSGIVYVGALVAAVLLEGVPLAVLLALLAAIGIYELTAMAVETKIPRFATVLDVASGVMLVLASSAHFLWEKPTFGVTLLMIFVGTMLARVLMQLYAVHGNAVNSLARSFMSQCYIALPLAAVPIIVEMTSAHIMLALLIFIWVNDTGAFCVGSLFGRHRLFERISPKKSWEGFWGGMLFCIAAAFVMRGFFEQYYVDFSYGAMCCIGIVVSVAATFGDLIESLIKRTCNVKDSGHLIPGHGGVLDRIDSLLLVIPVSLILFVLIQ